MWIMLLLLTAPSERVRHSRARRRSSHRTAGCFLVLRLIQFSTIRERSAFLFFLVGRLSWLVGLRPLSSQPSSPTSIQRAQVPRVHGRVDQVVNLTSQEFSVSRNNQNTGIQQWHHNICWANLAGDSQRFCSGVCLTA